MPTPPAADFSVPHLLPLPCTGSPETGFSATAGPQLPFAVARAYWIYNVPSGVVRGHHAHRAQQQLLIAVSGRLDITVENPAGQQQHFTLARPDVGLYLPGLYWRTVCFQEQAVLLCLVSEPYSEASYLRDYAAFRALGKDENPTPAIP